MLITTAIRLRILTYQVGLMDPIQGHLDFKGFIYLVKGLRPDSINHKLVMQSPTTPLDCTFFVTFERSSTRSYFQTSIS